MAGASPTPHLSAVRPAWAISGGRLTIEGHGFDLETLPDVRIGDRSARIVFASPRELTVLVPDGVTAGRARIQVGTAATAATEVELGAPVARGLHQVDSPVLDRAGNLYVTYSGTRGEPAPVAIFRVGVDGSREPFASGISNPTSMAFDPSGDLFVSSRFEGKVYRVSPQGQVDVAVSELGVASGIAFDAGGTLFVGDRSGTIFRVDGAGHTAVHASLPASIAAYHLAAGPDGALYVTAPTLSSSDALYRVDADGAVDVMQIGFGRPQGLAFDPHGTLYVVDALDGAAGLYAVARNAPPMLVLAAPALIGVAFGPDGAVIVASNDTAYRLMPPARP